MKLSSPYQSNNSKLIKVWYNLEKQLRDTSTQESQVNNFYSSQKNRPTSSNLYKQYVDYQHNNVESSQSLQKSMSPGRSLTGMSSKFIGLSTVSSNKQIINRPYTANVQANKVSSYKRPMTAINTNSQRPQSVISEQMQTNDSTYLQRKPISTLSSVKSLLSLKAMARPHQRFGSENIHVPKNDLILINELNQSELQLVIESSEFIHTLKVDRIIDLYNAKCVDSNQKYQPHHAVKFVEKLKKQCTHQQFNMSECQLGSKSAIVLKELLVKNNHFCQLNLSKNNLGDLGLIEVGKIILRNQNFISLDVSSNNITPQGAFQFFTIIQKSYSLISIDISSRDGLNRNKVGVYGCEPLETLFKSDHPLQFLNLKGTSIGISGFECILAGLQNNESLVYLNVAQNDLEFQACALMEVYMETTHLEELIFSQNKIGNTGVECFAALLVKPFFRIRRLDLSSCKVRSFGMTKLLQSLQVNTFMEVLIMDDNCLSGSQILQNLGNALNQIEGVLGSKCPLEYLSLANCQISAMGAERLGLGLHKNTSLTTLILKNNRIGDLGGETIAGGLKLEYIDMKSCVLGDVSSLSISNLIRDSLHLHTIILCDNNFDDSAGALFTEAVRNNPRIKNLNLQQNPMGYRYQEDVEKNIKRNLFFQNTNKVPEFQKKVDELTEFESQKFGIVAEDMRLQETQNQIEQEMNTAQIKKVQIRQDELKQTEEIETYFYSVIQQVRNLDKQKDRLEQSVIEEGGAMDDHIIDQTRVIGQTQQDVIHLEKDIRFMKDHLQQRKVQLESKVEQLKRDLVEKTRQNSNTDTGFRSFENSINTLKQKISQAEQKINPQKHPQLISENIIDGGEKSMRPIKEQQKSKKQSKKQSKK